MHLNEKTITEAIIKRYTEKLLDSLKCDVAIVGGGPSGLVAAAELAGAGWKTCLFERKLSIGGGMWGGGMMMNEIVVQEEGNVAARDIMDKVFEVSDAKWRGIGVIPGSGLGIRPGYAKYDAEVQLAVKAEKTVENKQCICGLVLKGVKEPTDCALFGKECTPENPVGACMVSGEGACAAYFKYR